MERRYHERTSNKSQDENTSQVSDELRYLSSSQIPSFSCFFRSTRPLLQQCEARIVSADPYASVDRKINLSPIAAVHA
jgi:hypothetical protein